MSNEQQSIFARLGLSEGATADDVADLLYNYEGVSCDGCPAAEKCRKADECLKHLGTALFTALCAREREAGKREAWEKMCPHCPSSYCNNTKCKAMDWDAPDMDWCPLLKGGQK